MPGPAYQPLFENFWCLPLNHVTNEQTFSSPGTWTKPPEVEWIEVITVGGGGGGGAGNQPPTPGFGGGGGGGAVRYEYIPVTGPLSVTIGAGGTGAIGPINPATTSTSGGSTYLGPLPGGLCLAGGGGAGGSYLLAPQPAPLFPLVNGSPATPSTLGGGGGSPALTHPNSPLANAPVEYGVGGTGTPSNGYRKGGGAWRGGWQFLGNGRGYSGFGGGGGSATDPANPNGNLQNTLADGAGIMGLTPGGGANAIANTGGGGGGGGDTSSSPPASPAAPVNGGDGGSGFCIIRWKQYS